MTDKVQGDDTIFRTDCLLCTIPLSSLKESFTYAVPGNQKEQYTSIFVISWKILNSIKRMVCLLA